MVSLKDEEHIVNLKPVLSSSSWQINSDYTIFVSSFSNILLI